MYSLVRLAFRYMYGLHGSALIACLMALGAHHGLAAQQSNPGTEESDPEAEAEAVEGLAGHWWTLWSEPSTNDRFLLGLFTIHVYSPQNGWSNDEVGGVIYKGFYAATFETTHGPRGYSVGFERLWKRGIRRPFEWGLGFRTGLVYGYDHRLGWLADRIPVLPMAQPIAFARLGPLTADLTYTWIVMSVTAGLSF